jgi:hypothetical protein
MKITDQGLETQIQLAEFESQTILDHDVKGAFQKDIFMADSEMLKVHEVMLQDLLRKQSPPPAPTNPPPNQWRVVASYILNSGVPKLKYTITNSSIGQFSCEMNETDRGFVVSQTRCVVPEESVLDPNVRGKFIDRVFMLDPAYAEKHKDLLKKVEKPAQVVTECQVSCPGCNFLQSNPTGSNPTCVVCNHWFDPHVQNPSQKDDPQSVVTPAPVTMEGNAKTASCSSSSQAIQDDWENDLSSEEEIAQPTPVPTTPPQPQTSAPVEHSEISKVVNPEEKKNIMAICK